MVWVGWAMGVEFVLSLVLGGGVRAVGVVGCAVVCAIGGDGSGAVEFGDRYWLWWQVGIWR